MSERKALAAHPKLDMKIYDKESAQAAIDLNIGWEWIDLKEKNESKDKRNSRKGQPDGNE